MVAAWLRARVFGLATFGVLAVAAGVGAESRSHRVNAGADPTRPEVDQVQFSVDGKWVVWVQRSFTLDQSRLMASPRWSGSVATQLTPVLGGSEAITSISISNVGRKVAWIQRGVAGLNPHVWSAPLDGSSEAVRLSPILAWHAQTPSLVVAGDRAIFVGDYREEGLPELWTAPLDGSQLATRLHSDPAPGGAIATESPIVLEGGIPRVLFRADLEGDGHVDLWIAPADGSSPPNRLSAVPGGAGDVEPYETGVTRDGSRVLYVEGEGFWGQRSLWSAPMDGSESAILLSGPTGNWPRIGYRKFDPTGEFVTYRADSDGDNFEELWISPIAGPASESVRLVEASVEGLSSLQSLEQFHSPSGDLLTFSAILETAEAREIWTVPVDGSMPPTRRNPIPEPGIPIPGQLLFSDGKPQVAFFGRYASAGEYGIWSAEAESTAGPNRLDGLSEGDLLGTARTSIEGSAVVFTVWRSGSYVDLWSARRDGSSSPVRIYEEADQGDGVRGQWIGAGDRTVVFETGLEPWHLREVWEVPLDGPASAVRRIHPEPVPGTNVVRLRASVDGFATLFLGDFDAIADTELWIADEMIFRADQEWGNLEEWSLVDP